MRLNFVRKSKKCRQIADIATFLFSKPKKPLRTESRIKVYQHIIIWRRVDQSREYILIVM